MNIETWVNNWQENWVCFKDDCILVKDFIEFPQDRHSISVNEKVVDAARRSLALLSTCFCAVAGLGCLFAGEILCGVILLSSAIVFYDGFLILKNLARLKSPVDAAIQATKGKNLLKGATSFIKSLSSSVSANAQLHASLQSNNKVNVNVITKDTNLKFLWDSLLVYLSPQKFCL